VDDVESNIEMIENLLYGQDISVERAYSGEWALEILDNYRPDLILLDLKLTGMNGFQVAQKIKENPYTKHIPVIACTATVTESDKIENSGLFDAIVFKPIVRNILFLKLAQFLPCRKMDIPSKTEEEKSLRNMDMEKIPALLKTMEKNILPEWNTIKDDLIIYDIEAFADLLHKRTQSFHCELIEDYVIRLKEFIESFDVENLESCIQSFPQLLESIRNLQKS
jgi:CheY-like chemotaxis protein